MVSVVVVGTLDTKGVEHRHLAEQIRRLGARAILVDVGVGEPAVDADVDNLTVAAAAGTTVEELSARGDRGDAVDTMARGAGIVLRSLHDQKRLDGVVALGGGGGTTLAGAAFAVLPVGVPKLIVSTVAAGDMRPHVHGQDITFTYAVLDIAGLNPVTRSIVDNAAGAIVGMAGIAAARDDEPRGPGAGGRPMIAITSFGVTTHAVESARAAVETAGYEPLVFHAVGSGGESLEALIRAGSLAGVLDLTTTELADDLVGGVMSAGPSRLTAAADTATPQVVSVGALDIVNLGPLDRIAPEHRGRRLVAHNAQMTLMRTNTGEAAELGRRLAAKLNRGRGPTALFLPLAGTSALSTADGPLYDADADEALFDAIRTHLDDSVALVELAVDVNDDRFANAMVEELLSYLTFTPEETS
ncbi:Tm-1-like ATP-binding domain-containing protein [Mycobacterium yunnanensis]|uniref:Tm-1-like ATP-binding domain-containing protein n=1 Tax=Mycobacterium yunnanensis TaxID=368477 RepID=A0A9X2YWH5_9MYCO|nr:Tm-1-like ATP-binding domain-containing protein [Mycobacterium yunnanensis]MCV7419995.1 Tm-1-like ATP-binding domain-containing protein [Mycobacterium yunnanensis]